MTWKQVLVYCYCMYWQYIAYRRSLHCTCRWTFRCACQENIQTQVGIFWQVWNIMASVPFVYSCVFTIHLFIINTTREYSCSLQLLTFKMMTSRPQRNKGMHILYLIRISVLVVLSIRDPIYIAYILILMLQIFEEKN